MSPIPPTRQFLRVGRQERSQNLRIFIENQKKMHYDSSITFCDLRLDSCVCFKVITNWAWLFKTTSLVNDIVS